METGLNMCEATDDGVEDTLAVSVVYREVRRLQEKQDCRELWRCKNNALVGRLPFLYAIFNRLLPLLAVEPMTESFQSTDHDKSIMTNH